MAQGQANPNANYEFPKYGRLQKLATILSADNIYQGLNNVYAQNVANAQIAQTLAARQQLYGAALGTDPATGQARINSMPNLGMISPEDVNRLLPSIGNSDFGFNQALLNAGGMPSNYGIAPAAQVQQQGQQINTRQGDVTDSKVARDILPQTIQQGQQIGNAPGFIQGPKGLAAQLQQPVGLDDGTGNVIPGTGTGVINAPNGPMLATGTAAQGYIPQTVSPFLKPGIKPSDLNTSLSTGVTNAQAQQTLGETTRHNKATEGLTQQIINATRNNEGGYANNPSYPPQPNAAQMAYAAFQRGDLTPDQYAGTLGANSGLKAPDAKEMQYMDKLARQIEAAGASGGFFGIGAHGANTAKQNQLIRKYNSLAARYGINQLPFGGESQKKLENTGKGLYGVKY